MRKICAFFCQEDVSLDIEPLIEQQIYKLITEHNVDTFWLRGFGWFDIYASGVLRKVKNKHPKIQIIHSDTLQKTTIQNIIKNTDYIITYIPIANNNFYEEFRNKKNIINLANLIK